MLKNMEKLKKLLIVTFIIFITLVSPAFAVTPDENAAAIEEVRLH